MKREWNKLRKTKWFIPVIIVLSLVLVFVASQPSTTAESDPERVQRLTESFACPECDGQSVAESNASVAANISRFIESEVAAGSTDQEIEESLLASWGPSVLLAPSFDGVAVWVWTIPIAAAIVGALFLVSRYFPDILSARRTKGLVATVIVVATIGLSALSLGSFLGERGINDEITGAINRTPGQRISECSDRASSGDVTGGISCLDELLEQDPDNSFILANKGWLFALTARSAEDPGQIQTLNEFAIENLNRAIDLRDSNRDAFAWRAIVHDWTGSPESACEDLDRLYDLSPTELMLDLTAHLADGCATT